MKPLIAPRDFCWRTKYLPDMPPIFPVSTSIRATITSTSTVSGMLVPTMAMNTDTRVITVLNSWGMLWEISIRRVSVSLVYRLIISPWVWVSKYFIGRCCIWEKRSSLMSFSIPWETFTISQLYVKVVATPIRYISAMVPMAFKRPVNTGVSIASRGSI